MTETDIIQITQEAIVVLLIISSPLLLIGMGVGLVISLVQALTQIQESTIAFVPKIIVMFGALVFLLPWMTTKLLDFGLRLQPLIIGTGGN
jgi:flagellar biosynthetic protein FliQ